jgi:predicted nucleotidyltransferase
VKIMPLDEKELIGMIFQRWEKEWKDEKNKQVASIYNQIVDIMAKNKAHIDEMIVALEIAVQEALAAKVKMIRQERKMPAEVKG